MNTELIKENLTPGPFSRQAWLSWFCQESSPDQARPQGNCLMVDIWLFLFFFAVPSDVSEMLGLTAISCTTSGKASVIMTGYSASICPYLVPDGCNSGSSSISAPYRLQSLPSRRSGRVGQSQNLRPQSSVGFGVLFSCSKMVQPPFMVFCLFYTIL